MCPHIGDRLMHPAHRQRLAREKARRELTICALPLCDSKVMRNEQGEGLGICAHCAINVADYLRVLENTPAMTERQFQREMRELREQERAEREAEARASAPGWIYYIRIDDRIKIGYSADVRQRMKSYPPHATLLAVHPGTRTLETETHAKFRNCRAAGREWFHAAPELEAHIAEMVDTFGPPAGRHIYKFREGTGQTIKPGRRSRR